MRFTCRGAASRRQLLFTAAGAGLGAAACLCCPPPPPALASEWGYDCASGPSTWSGSCTAGGAQSPIDVPLPPAGAAAPPPGALRPRYPRRLAGATCANNGHGSPEIIAPPGTAFCEIDGARYELVQVHFHCTAEHSLGGGARAPMEAHLVHRAATPGGGGGLAVLAVTLRLGAANPVLQAALDAAPAAPGGVVPLPRGVSLQALLPPPHGAGQHRPYATYRGSLTTPPCSEGVRWFVFTEPRTVSAQQVLQFQQFGGGGGGALGRNARPQQPLNGRAVQYFS
jgi:carbonic anhydrase